MSYPVIGASSKRSLRGYWETQSINMCAYRGRRAAGTLSSVYMERLFEGIEGQADAVHTLGKEMCMGADGGLPGLPDLEPARPPKYIRKRSPAFQMRCMPLSKASDLTRKSGKACTMTA